MHSMTIICFSISKSKASKANELDMKCAIHSSVQLLFETLSTSGSIQWASIELKIFVWNLHYLCAIVTKTGMWQQNLGTLYRNTWWFFGGSQAVICEHWTNVLMLMVHFLQFFIVNLIKTCFLHYCFQYLSTFAEVSFIL